MTTTVVTPTVSLDVIDRPWNIRREVGDTAELEGSIENIGLIEPLVVRPAGDRYVLLAGFRRYQALANLGHADAPVHIINHADEDLETSRIALQLVENLQRVDLDPLEEASAYGQLKQFGWKQTDIASRIGRSEGHVSRRLALLNLPDSAIDLAEAGRLSNESLYELSRVASAGGDVDGLVTQLAENHEYDDEPINTEEINHMAQQAVRRAKADGELSARKIELEEQGVAVREVDTDEYGTPQLPKDRLGYGDIDLDHDAHLKEPCALVCLYVRWDSIYESQHCTDRRRHAADGASSLKLETKPKTSTGDGENKQRAAHRRLVDSMNEAADQILERRPPARDKVLSRLVVLYLDSIGADAHTKATRLLDVFEETRDEYKPLRRLYDEADSASRNRILLAAVLGHGYVKSSSFHLYDDARRPHLDFLAECGEPIDLDRIEKGATVDSVVADAIAEGKARGI